MENSSFETLPGDIKTEILLRLSLKSLVKFIFVSKKWASFIRSEEFKGRYLKRSTERPRVMFMVGRVTSEPPEPEMLWLRSIYKGQRRYQHVSKYMEKLFHSVYQEKEPLLSCGQQQLRIPLEPVTCSVSPPVRGLICLQLGTKIVICNPGAKTFRDLPEIQANKITTIKCFLGYDEATNVFKVLSITWYFNDLLDEKPITTYLVCTMGSDEESWRPITCQQVHLPDTEGLFIDGVLYYVATRYSDDARVIMSFDMMSEDFSVIEISEDVRLSSCWNLVNYKGEVALSSCVDYDTGVLQMWSRDEMGVWLSKIIKISHLKETIGRVYVRFGFRGTIGTRVHVFTEDTYSNNGSPYIVLYYDTETKNLRRFDIEELIEGRSVETFLDHVDSTWLI